MKIEPDLTACAPAPESRCPFPLAVSHQRVLALQSGAEGAYAYHHGLQELAASLLQFVSICALSAYLRSPQRSAGCDRAVDAELSNTERPIYESWLAVLTLVLESMKEARHPLIELIEAFYFANRSRESPVGEAVVHMQRWIGLRARQRTFVSHEDLFELLGYYLTHDQGWAASSTTFPAAEFQQRAQILHAALSAVFAEFMALADWELVGAREEGGKLQRLSVMGLSIVPALEAARQPEELTNQHVYLLNSQAGSAQPVLDLFPWLSLERCSGCGGQTTWAIATSPTQAFQWVCQRCSTAHALTDHAQQELARLLHRTAPAPAHEAAPPTPVEPAASPHPAVEQVREKVQQRFEIEMPLTHAWPVFASQLLAWDERGGWLSLVEDGRVAWRSPQRFALRFVRTAPGSALAAAWDGRLVIFQTGKPPIWLEADGTIADARRLDSLWIAGTWKKSLFSIDPNGDVERFPDVNEGAYRIAVMEQSGWLAVAALNGGIGLYQKDRKVLSIAPLARLGSLAFAGKNLLAAAACHLHTLSLAGKELSVEALSPNCNFELDQLPGSEDCLLVRNHVEGLRIDGSGRRMPFFHLPRKSSLLSYCSRPGLILVAPESGGCALWDASEEIFAWKQGYRAKLSMDGSAIAAYSSDRAALYEVAV
jgi:hypothetical protein